MKEELVSYQVAKLAKEKGFNWSSNFSYWNDETLHIISSYNNNEINLAAPTQSLLQRWLRDVHNIYLVPTTDIATHLYSWELYGFKTRVSELGEWNEFKTYEEALEAGILKALELI